MAKLDFLNQLKTLKFEFSEPSPNFVCVEYEIPVGKFKGQKVLMAFEVYDTFPMNPPPGPHFKPHLLPITGAGGSHPYGAVHHSPLGADWQYWSRPFQNEWNKTEKTVKVYLAHIKNLLATII